MGVCFFVPLTRPPLTPPENRHSESGPQAYHSAELWYIFGTLQRCWRRFDGRHYDLSRDMVDYWTNFAKNGDPNGDGLAIWPAFDGTGSRTLLLNERKRETISVADENMTKMYRFLFDKLREN